MGVNVAASVREAAGVALGVAVSPDVGLGVTVGPGVADGVRENIGVDLGISTMKDPGESVGARVPVGDVEAGFMLRL